MALSKAALVLVVGLCASACGGSGSSPTTPTSTGSSVTYSFLSAIVNPSVLPVGETAFARVEGWTNTAGDRIYGPVPVKTWTSSNPSAATVSASGTVVAILPGTATITGASDAGPYAATVEVFGDRDIEALTVTCDDTPPGVPSTLCTVAARTRSGSGPVKATWTTSRPEVASLATNDSTPSIVVSVRRVTPGMSVITAEYGAFTGSALVEFKN